MNLWMMKNDLQTKLSRLESCIKTQRDNLSQGYMHGLMNGMVLSHSIFTGDAPTWAKLPTKNSKNKIRHKKGRRR